MQCPRCQHANSSELILCLGRNRHVVPLSEARQGRDHGR
jgi:hypothetical protein